MTKSRRPGKRLVPPSPLRLGFLPENDCAPAVVAHALGCFTRQGLTVELQREASCACLRDHLLQGTLDAAIGPATLPFVLSLGLDFDQCPCVSGLMVSSQGNTITISRRLWERGVHNAATLRDRVFKDWGKHTYTFGVGFPYSPQYFLLGAWLRAAQLVPHAHVRIVVMSPEQMFPMLELGYLDGFCVGEPWSSVATDAAKGVCLTTSAQLSPSHPEKALIVRHSFAIRRADEHERLIAALLEAGRWCDTTTEREWLCRLLARSEYINAPADCIRAGLFGPFRAPATTSEASQKLNRLGGPQTHEPSGEKAAWVTNFLWDLVHLHRASAPGIRRPDCIFRRDIYRNALQRVHLTPNSPTSGPRQTKAPDTFCACV